MPFTHDKAYGSSNLPAPMCNKEEAKDLSSIGSRPGNREQVLFLVEENLMMSFLKGTLRRREKAVLLVK